MFIRTITIAAQPPIQIELHFDDRQRAERQPVPLTDNGNESIIFSDDYGQRAIISDSAIILTDVITDLDQVNNIQSKTEIAKVFGVIRHEKEIHSQPMIKEFIERKNAEKAAQQQMPPFMVQS